ncbi:hypothetical protein CEQ21_23155 [Niallia circulans]|uniref:Uncharacterized protein n=1 Tax=Niallia circulans TaxID=1397 RepID=A0A553SMV6_NIACI|nr:hypothetical protein [Niallia circulans]TRZ38302.1 hypothetical protein CEQ21_23155 [Niallia circulans]
MNTKLIIVEGLPGSGKSTTAATIHEILQNHPIKSELFLEGNLEHPADYDGVACFSPSEWSLLEKNINKKDILHSSVEYNNGLFLLPYRKLMNQNKGLFTDIELSSIFQHDIYELPFEQYAALAVKKWADFAETAWHNDKIYIFECSFLQNPLTIGMIKWAEAQERLTEHIARLEEIICKLNPVLFYVSQEDVKGSFLKAFDERPVDWSTGFIDYYTKQGFGKMHQLHGIDGTIQVLQARKKLELKMYENLSIQKFILNNSSYNLQRSDIVKMLTSTHII